MSDFARRLTAWHRRHGRHDLPWQNTTDPYRVWLSEIMLQQTQVATVIPYYERFLARFPTLADLAAAPVAEVMALWSGLGYYARARNLHACAQAVVARHGGTFPREAAALAALPGIGQSTAHAIADFCFGAQLPILDGNVKRVLCRCFGVDGFPGDAAVVQRLWQLAASLLPPRAAATYIQAQMDLGATVCTRSKPRCGECPVAADCVARRDERIAALPTPKPRRAVPERAATLLLLTHGNRVLLEQRPAAGIWGGLLSLPELPDGVDVDSRARMLGCRAGAAQELPPLIHVFSHFRLRIAPLRVAVEPLPGVAEPGLRWLSAAEMGSAPLPAPIRKLLAGLFAAPGSSILPVG
ncbi:MAG: A/G-specific adenine glycosylase [Rhodocyclaceae bacterium]|nr:A/G-specific adenine glycosylase [Rhodocyclaceae bacterium]